MKTETYIMRLALLLILASFGCAKGQLVFPDNVIIKNSQNDQTATYIASFTPTSAEEGDTVTITGVNFTGATVVTFGGVAADGFIVESSTTIKAAVAGGASGSVSVTSPQGSSSLAGFTFINNVPPGDTLWAVISAGQSNMDGRATDAFYYENADRSVTGVQMYNWTKKTFQIFDYNNNTGGQSNTSPSWAGDIICNRMIRDSLSIDTVWMIKATLGGSSLSPSAMVTGSWTIPQDSVEAGNHKMYDTLLNRINGARAYAAARGKVLGIKAMLWHQGESDAGFASAYSYRLDRLFDALRAEVGNPTLPIIMGSVPPASVYYNVNIHNIHIAIAAADPDIYLVDLDSTPLGPDNAHFQSAGQYYFGHEMFKILRNLW